MAGVGTAYPADYSVTYSGPQYMAQQGRTAMSAAMAGATAARPLGGISGVRPGTPTTIATATSTAWTVTPFAGYIDLETSATNGGYFFSFLGNSTGSVTAAAGSARVDLLYVQIADVNTGDSTTVAPRVILDYQVGVAGAGIPALTAPRAFVIAQINVPASGGGAPTVTWVAPYAVAAGGQGAVNTSTQLPASGTLGDKILAYDTGIVYRFNGTNWRAWDSDWITYTPILAGLVLGTGGAQNCAYKYTAGQVEVACKFTLGTGFTVTTGNNNIGLPVNAAAVKHPFMTYKGVSSIWDTSASTPYVMFVAANDSNVDSCRIYSANGSGGFAFWGPTSPVSAGMAAGDIIALELTYRPA